MLAASAPIIAAVAVAGCADTSVLPGRGGHARRGDPAVAVIVAWANALRDGHVQVAAGYFRIPSLFANGPGDTFVLRSLQEAVVVNRLLPCGATYISSERHGELINALFRLSDRRGPGGGPGGCGSGAGQTARVVFTIDNGKITRWVRAPSQPGDNSQKPHGTPPGTSTVPPHKPPTTKTLQVPTAPIPTVTSTTPNPSV